MGALKPKYVPTTTTTSSTSAPWQPAQAALKTGIKAAENMYKTDVGYKPWSGPLQANLSGDTLDAINTTRSIVAGQGGLLGQQAYDFSRNLIANGGVDPRMQPTIDSLGKISERGGLDPRMQSSLLRMDNIAAQGGIDPRMQPQLDQMAATARGDNLSVVNPALQTMLDRAGQRAAASVAGNMSASGRYGSAGSQSAITQGMLDAMNPILAQNYENERNRQIQAQGQLADIYNNAQNTALQTNSSLADIYNTGQNNAMRAQGMLSNIFDSGQNRALQTASNSQTFTDALYDPARRQAAIGGMLDDRASALLDAQVSQWDQIQSRPWEQVSRLMGIAGGAGQMGGTQSGTANGYRSQQSGLMNGIGAATSLSGLLGRFF